MRPWKNDNDDGKDDLKDAIDADPRIDFEPPDSEAQGGGGEGTDQGG